MHDDLWEAWVSYVSKYFDLFTENLLWSVFLTSAAIHAIVLITSPVEAVYKWYRRQSSDSDTCIPYIAALVGSSLWLQYSVYIYDIKLILLQSYAVTMQTLFLIILLAYRSRPRRLIRLVILLFVVLIVFIIYVHGLSEDDGKEMSGRIASSAQIAGSLVCPYLIYKAITTRCIDFVPLAPVVATWVMELHAIIYSLGINDFYMTLANATFFCMDGSLLAMFFIFPTERPLEEAKVEGMSMFNLGGPKLSTIHARSE